MLPVDPVEVERLRRYGLTYQQIAARLGVPLHVVFNVARRAA